MHIIEREAENFTSEWQLGLVKGQNHDRQKKIPVGSFEFTFEFLQISERRPDYSESHF